MKKFLKEFGDFFFENFYSIATILLIIAGVIIFGCLVLPMLITLTRDTWAYALQ